MSGRLASSFLHPFAPRPGVLWGGNMLALLPLLAFICPARAVINLSLQPPVSQDVPHTVSWTRESNDPETFFLIKVRPDRLPNTIHVSGNPVEVRTDNATSGEASVSFGQIATYTLLATLNVDRDLARLQRLGYAENIQVLAGEDPSASGPGDDDDRDDGGPITGTVILPPMPSSTSTSVSMIPTASAVQPSSSPEGQVESSGMSSSKKTAVIAGSVAGGVGVLVLVGLLLFFLHRRSKRRRAGFEPEAMSRASSVLGHSPLIKDGSSVGIAPDISEISQASSPAAAIVTWPLDEKTTLPMTLSRAESRPTRNSEFMPLTDRQMGLQEQLYKLKSKLLTLDERSEEFEQLMQRIDVLEQMLKSPWARELTDELPTGFESLNLDLKQ